MEKPDVINPRSAMSRAHDDPGARWQQDTVHSGDNRL